MKELIDDFHTHLTLSDEDIPKYAFGWITPMLMKSDSRARFVAKWLSFLGTKSGLDRLALILTANRKTSRQRCIEYFKVFSSANSLLMDLEGSMNAGKTKRSYEEQIKEAICLKREFNINIYLFINPDRENMLELVEKYYNDFDGYKYYPPLCGSINNDVVIDILTRFPKKNIIIHTTNTSPIFDRDLEKDMCGDMAHPIHTIHLLSKFPHINFIFAHAGGNKWLTDCASICSKYKNAYLDISYTFGDKDNLNALKWLFRIIPKKILFGSDYYMIDYKEFLKLPYFKEMQENNALLR